MYRAGLYLRISQDDEGTGLGVERQRADCTALANRRGWQIVDEYPDNNVSAFRGKKRPEYDRLMTDLRSGRVDALVVYDIDRLYRQPRELENLIDLFAERELQFATYTGDLDLSTDDGRFMARLLVNFANKTSADTRRRQKRKAIQVATAGLPHGGPRPYGFEKDRVTLRPAEVAVIQQAADDLIAGDSVRSVCLALNERGEFGARGRLWQPSTLKRMLLRPRLVGKRSHRPTGRTRTGSGTTVYRATWPAILTDEQADALSAILNDATRRRGGAPVRHLLSSLLRCAVCGTRMVHTPATRHNGANYACPAKPRGLGCVGIRAEQTEAFVVEQVLAVIGSDRPSVPALVTVAESTAPERERLDEVARQYASGAIDSATASRRESAINRRIEEKSARIAKTEAIVVRVARGEALAREGARLGERWPSLTVDEQRAVLASVIDRILIRKATRTNVLDPSRIKIDWAPYQGPLTVVRTGASGRSDAEVLALGREMQREQRGG